MWHKFCWVELIGPGLFYVIVYKVTKDPDDEEKTIRTIIASYPLLIQKDKVVPVLNVEELEIHRWFNISNPTLLPTGNIDTYVHYLGPIPIAEPIPTPCSPFVMPTPMNVAPPDFSGARVLDHLPGENYTNFAMEFTATGQIQINYRNAKGRMKIFGSVQDQWRSAFEEVGTGWIRIDPIIKPEEFLKTDQKTYILKVVGPRTDIWVNGKYSLGKDYMYQADFLKKGNFTMEEGQIDFPLKIMELPDNVFYTPLPRKLPLVVDMTNKIDLERYTGHDYVGSIFTNHLGTRIKRTYGTKYLPGLRTTGYNNVYPETKDLWGNRETKFRIRFCGNICVWGERTKDNENGLLINFLGDAWGPAGFYQMLGPHGGEPQRICLEKFDPLHKGRDLKISIMCIDDEMGLFVEGKQHSIVKGIDLGTGATSIKNGNSGVLECDDVLLSGLLQVTAI